MDSEIFYLSKEKLGELKIELDKLKTVERQQVAKDLEYSKSLGDLSENAEYHEAREKQADIEDRINQVEHILKNAEVVSDHKGGTVSVGSEVSIKKTGGKEEKFKIVGSEEADMISGKISYQSPLGEALIDKKKGETVAVTTPKGETKYKILSVK